MSFVSSDSPGNGKPAGSHSAPWVMCRGMNTAGVKRACAAGVTKFLFGTGEISAVDPLSRSADAGPECQMGARTVHSLWSTLDRKVGRAPTRKTRDVRQNRQ